jgi:hypothetical protein
MEAEPSGVRNPPLPLANRPGQDFSHPSSSVYRPFCELIIIVLSIVDTIIHYPHLPLLLYLRYFYTVTLAGLDTTWSLAVSTQTQQLNPPSKRCPLSQRSLLYRTLVEHIVTLMHQ